ncbi:hypothetical protein ACLGI4_28580 [Streptomyces sp. HMX112]|uniref:hypothetical protein n=1 Tax=Streptomyces sp. HMX112 TaxID=3390850 RepID=UPI003A7F81EA
MDQLEETTDARDRAALGVLAALEAIEAAARSAPAVRRTADHRCRSGGAADHRRRSQALRALLTSRLSVITASGTRIPYAQLQRPHSAGLVGIVTTHPVHAGQPVNLTDTGVPRCPLAAVRSRASLHCRRRGRVPGRPLPRSGADPRGCKCLPRLEQALEPA